MSNWARPNREPVAPRRSKLAADEIKATLFDAVGALKLGRRHRPDYLMLVVTLALSIFGLIILLSISPAINGSDEKASMWFMIKQVAFLFVGLVAFAAASKVPLDIWRKYGSRIFLIGLIICFLLPIMGWLRIPPAYCTLGACRWFSLGGIGTFQPAEFLKFGTVLFVAGFLAVRVARNELSSFRKTMVPLGVVVITTLGVIVMMQKDLGTGISLLAIILAELIVAGVKMKSLLKIIGVVAGLGILSIVLVPHRMSRVATFMGQGNEAADYHINQAMIALGSGGLTGRGLGQSVQAYGWLPEAIHDSIFAVIGESLGFIGTLVVICTFAFLLRIIIKKVDFTENMYLRLILAGVFGWVAAHVVLNIGAMTHMIPLTGITLPLVSLGGTSLMFIMLSLGLVFAISRYTTHRKVKAEGGEADENSLGRRRVRRTRYASHSSR